MEQNRFKNTITRAALTLTLVLNFGEENTTGIVDAEANSSFIILHLAKPGTRLMGASLTSNPRSPDSTSTEARRS